MLERLEISYGWRSNKGYVSQMFASVITISEDEEKRKKILEKIERSEKSGDVDLVKRSYASLIKNFRDEEQALSDLNMAAFKLEYRLENQIKEVEKAISKVKDPDVEGLLQQLKTIVNTFREMINREKKKSRDFYYDNILPRDLSVLTKDVILKVMANDAKIENNIINPIKTVVKHIKSLSKVVLNKELIKKLKEQIKWFESYAKEEIKALIQEEDYIIVLLFKLRKENVTEFTELHDLVKKQGFPKLISQELTKKDLNEVEKFLKDKGARAIWANEFLEKKAV